MTKERMEFERLNTLAKKLATYENKVSQSLYDALQVMRSEMSKIYEKYASGGILTKAEMTRYNRYVSMEKQMLKALKPALKENIADMKKLTPDMYGEAFWREAWVIDNETGLRINWGTFNKDTLYEITETNTLKQIALKKYPLEAQSAIRSALFNGLTIGKTLPKMMRDIKKALNIINYKAMRIARTEAMTAINAGIADVYTRAKEKGVEGKEIWVATLDLRTRPDHGHMDGKVKDPETGTFNLAGEHPPYPCWEGLSGGQRINCRCSTRFEIEGYSPQLRRSREDGVIPYQTYDEWYDARYKVPDKIPLEE